MRATPTPIGMRNRHPFLYLYRPVVLSILSVRVKRDAIQFRYRHRHRYSTALLSCDRARYRYVSTCQTVSR